MGLLDFLEPKSDSRGRKRLRPASPPTPDSPAPPSGNHRDREGRAEDRHDGGYRPRNRSAYTSYPGDFCCPSGSGGPRRS